MKTSELKSAIDSREEEDENDDVIYLAALFVNSFRVYRQKCRLESFPKK